MTVSHLGRPCGESCSEVTASRFRPRALDTRDCADYLERGHEIYRDDEVPEALERATRAPESWTGWHALGGVPPGGGSSRR